MDKMAPKLVLELLHSSCINSYTTDERWIKL